MESEMALILAAKGSMTIPYIPVSPMSLVCPKCGVRQGQRCDILRGELEMVHIERIKSAAAIDGAAKKGRPTVVRC